jgi:hypothetical protein
MAKAEKIQPRASVINQDGKEVLKIDKIQFSIIFKDTLYFSVLGAFVGAIIGFILYTILIEIKGIPSFVPLLSGGVGILSLGYLGARWNLKDNKQSKAFYLNFSGNIYKAWREGSESKAEKGRTKNIHVQFVRVSPIKDTFGLKIKKNSAHIYDADCLIEKDTNMIRNYFKKNKVRTIS